MNAYSYCLAGVSPTYACATHAYLLLWLGSCLAYVCMCHSCILTFVAWLVPRRCVHVLRMHTCSYGLAQAPLMCASALHAYLLLWLGTFLACVCMCYAYVPTLMAWLVSRQCVHMLCMHTYSYGLSHVRMCYACVPTLMAWQFLACVCMYHAYVPTLMAWLVPRQCVHMLCMHTYS